MPKWLFYSLLSVAFYGVWGLVSGMAATTLNAPLLLLLTTLGQLPVAIFFAFTSKDLRAGKNLPLGIVWATLTSLCGSVGSLTLYEALVRGGKSSTVYPFISPYPLIAVLLARVFLKEKPNVVQLTGIAGGLVAMFLLSMEDSTVQDIKGLSLSGWVAYALITFLLFGASGVTQKLSTVYISTELSMAVFSAAYVPVAFVVYFLYKPDFHIPAKGWFQGTLIGVLWGMGILTQFAAYKWGKASIVTVVTSFATAVTVVLAVVFLGDPVNLRKVAGILMALAAGAALAYEKAQEPAPAPQAGTPSA